MLERGPGEIYGAVQHGSLDLRIAKLSDTAIIAQARKIAKQLVTDDPTLLQYPQLKQRIKPLRAMTYLN
jgi:RecG-like helicase